MSCELAVDLGHSFNLGLSLFLVKGVEENLNVLLAIEGNSGGLASDGCGIALFNNKYYLLKETYDIFQDCSVDSCESSASRSLLSSVSLGYRNIN